jgi:hypothetical protein
MNHWQTFNRAHFIPVSGTGSACSPILRSEIEFAPYLTGFSKVNWMPLSYSTKSFRRFIVTIPAL